MKTTSKITFKSCLHAIKLTHCQNAHSSGYTYTTILKRTIQTLNAIFNANMPLPMQISLFTSMLRHFNAKIPVEMSVRGS